MNLHSNFNLRWKEPAAFRRAIAQTNQSQSSVLLRPSLMLLICGLGLSGLWYHGNLIANSWPISIAIVVGTAWLGIYGVTWLSSRDPIIVFVGNDGVGRQINQGGCLRLECWRWEDITLCRLQDMELGGVTYRVLSLHGAQNELSVVGIAEHLDLQELESAIIGYGGSFVKSTQSRQSSPLDV